MVDNKNEGTRMLPEYGVEAGAKVMQVEHSNEPSDTSVLLSPPPTDNRLTVDL